MRVRRGFTLMEVTVSVTILALLAALLFPIFRQAKHRGTITSATERLRQIHLAVELYRADQTSSVEYGSMHAMGLPPIRTVDATKLGLGTPMLVSPCSDWTPPTGEAFEPPRFSNGYMPMPTEQFEEAVEELRGDTPLFIDLTCDENRAWSEGAYVEKRGLGVLMSGRLVHHRKIGDPLRYAWWP